LAFTDTDSYGGRWICVYSSNYEEEVLDIRRNAAGVSVDLANLRCFQEKAHAASTHYLRQRKYSSNENKGMVSKGTARYAS